MLYVLYFSLLNLFGYWHVGEVAEYYISFSEAHVYVEFRIDHHELDHLQIDVEDCDEEHMQALCLTKYINQHQSLKLDGKEIPLQLEKSYTQEGHYLLLLEGHLPSEDWKEIEVNNTCFYQLHASFKNRVILQLEHSEKSYLLSKDQPLLSYKR